jgi:uncharacterized protein YcsI (UPF0317 family)
MTSQLNVDTIVDKAGSGGTNVKIGNTSTYVSDGGAVTQNTVQGLCKAWNKTVKDGTGIEDSFNISSLTDTATGKQFHTTTNNMANDDYSMQLTPVDDNIEQVWCDGVTAAGFLSNSYGASAFEDEKHSVTVHGDLA